MAMIDVHKAATELGGQGSLRSETHPKEISGDVALHIASTCPPPLNLVLVLPADNSHAVTLTERQLVKVLVAVVPKAVDHTPVHDAHLLLHTWGVEAERGEVSMVHDQILTHVHPLNYAVTS